MIDVQTMHVRENLYVILFTGKFDKVVILLTGLFNYNTKPQHIGSI